MGIVNPGIHPWENPREFLTKLLLLSTNDRPRERYDGISLCDITHFAQDGDYRWFGYDEAPVFDVNTRQWMRYVTARPNNMLYLGTTELYDETYGDTYYEVT